MQNTIEDNNESSANAEQVSTKSMDRVHPNSRANRIAELEVGKSYSESVRVNVDKLGDYDLKAIKADLRNTLNKAASNATIRSGNEYTVEGGEFFTRSYDLLISVVVTRLS